MRPRPEHELLKMCEPWIARTNRLFDYWQNKDNPEEKRKKAAELHGAMHARVFGTFYNMITARMQAVQAQQKAQQQQRKKIILPGDNAMKALRNQANDQKSRLFNRRFKK